MQLFIAFVLQNNHQACTLSFLSDYKINDAKYCIFQFLFIPNHINCAFSTLRAMNIKISEIWDWPVSNIRRNLTRIVYFFNNYNVQFLYKDEMTKKCFLDSLQIWCTKLGAQLAYSSKLLTVNDQNGRSLQKRLKCKLF